MGLLIHGIINIRYIFESSCVSRAAQSTCDSATVYIYHFYFVKFAVNFIRDDIKRSFGDMRIKHHILEH